jgi:hypothetical protein
MNDSKFEETMREWFETNQERILGVSPESHFISSGHGGGYFDVDVLDPAGQIIRASRIIVWPTGECDVESLEFGGSEEVGFIHYDLKEPQELVEILEGVLTRLHPNA